MHVFFLKGNCLKGDLCPYSHSQDPEQPEKPQEEENTCSICYNPCGVNRRKFGLLSHCDHVFCLECIRTWRDKKKESTSSHSHTCPICRVKSHFVIPSYSFATGTQKKEIEEQYKSILKSIPCKHFNFGKGTCPFYNNCFYVHLNPDGTPAPVTKPTPAQKKKLTTEFIPMESLLRSLSWAEELSSNSDDTYSDYESDEDDDLRDRLIHLQLRMLLHDENLY